MPGGKDDARLDVARQAARLFLEKGVAGTTGDDIAAASGLSKRTVWRYFRSKESAVEPLFIASVLKFVARLRHWPAEASIETYLRACLIPEALTPEEVADDVLAVRLIALMPTEPALRAAWLMACQVGEDDLAGVFARRLDRPVDFEVRLCAATVMAALRAVDEDISTAAVNQGQVFTLADVIERLAQAFRISSTLPICDPGPFPQASAPTVAGLSRRSSPEIV